MQPRFHMGIHLGRNLNSSELITSMLDGSVVRARDYKELPESSAWSAEGLQAVKGTPYSPTGTLPVHYHDEEGLPKIPDLHPVDKEETARGFVLLGRHFEKIGHTDSCAKCRQMRRGQKTNSRA